MLPKINIRRTYLIARRDFLGYIKTWGFWLSFLMPFVIFTFVLLGSRMDINVEPMRYEAILDETGLHAENIKEYDKKNRFLPGTPNLENPANERTRYVDPPADNITELQLYLTGAKTFMVNDEPQSLSALLHIYEKDGKISADYWSANVTNERLKSVANRYFKVAAASGYISGANSELQGAYDKIDDLNKSLNPEEELTPRRTISFQALRTAENSSIKAKAFNANKRAEDGDQSVTLNDQIPTLVAVGAAFLLWLTIFSGSYMLLTSMLEEKLNKLLEMMLASTRMSEIMVGKLLGVAALTVTAMLPYIVLFVGGSVFLSLIVDPAIASVILGAITPKLIVFFFIFLILGYVFYGALFIAVGSLAESMQDAQTITTPIILILTACVMVVPLAIRSPDSPLLVFASWFPLSAPFGALARLPQDPPWWELALSAFFLFLLSIVVIWLAGRVLRYGVLSGAGIKGVTDWIKRVIFRRKSA